MTFKQFFDKVKLLWHSKPITVIVPVVALGVYWNSHGRNWQAFPSMSEWIVGIGLWTTRFDTAMKLFLGNTEKTDTTDKTEKKD